MRPYNKQEYQTKGLPSRRKSFSSPHRKRCLRVDKRAARQESVTRALQDAEEWACSLTEE